MTSKNLIWAAVVASLLGGCKSSSSDPQPNGTMPTNYQPITVTVSEDGAPNYDLKEAHVVTSNYQSGAPYLTITGLASNGKVLTVNFTRGTGSSPAYSTNEVAATLDGKTGVAASGTTVYDPQTRTATGSFGVTFPATGAIKGTFTAIPIP